MVPDLVEDLIIDDGKHKKKKNKMSRKLKMISLPEDFDDVDETIANMNPPQLPKHVKSAEFQVYIFFMLHFLFFYTTCIIHFVYFYSYEYRINFILVISRYLRITSIS